MLVNSPQKVSNQNFEGLVSYRGQVLENIPVLDGPVLLLVLFRNPRPVIEVLEQQDLPEVVCVNLQVDKQVILLQTLDGKVNLRLGLLEIEFLGVDKDFMEVGINYFAAQLLQVPQDQEEVLLHQRMN